MYNMRLTRVRIKRTKLQRPAAEQIHRQSLDLATQVYDIAIGNVAHESEHDFHCTRFQLCRRNGFRVYVQLNIFRNRYSESI